MEPRVHQHKKDYLLRLIDEIFAKLRKVLDRNINLSTEEKQNLLNDCFDFYQEYYEIGRKDTAENIVSKIDRFDLLEHYAQILLIEYKLAKSGDKDNLVKALSLVEYLEESDKSYSWDRVALREDILRLIESN